MYENVTMRRVRITIAAVKKQLLLHILSVVCGLIYKACYAHTPYSHLWHVQFYKIFSHLFARGTILPQKCYSI